MRTSVLLLLAFLIGASAAADPLPSVASGTIRRLELFASHYVAARNVDIWLPPGYGNGKRYDVLYMHDGQMLFDPSLTWNKQSWDAAGILARLIAAGRARPAIIVGIWNNGDMRHAEYFPEKFLPFIPDPVRSQFVQQALKNKPSADGYLRFLVEELKPYIDAHFQTRPERAHTFIMGSSMGGLISTYAICEYPDVFGGAAGLSTHWIGSFEPNAAIPLAAFEYLRGHLPAPESHRLYMDRGTLGLDANYGVAEAFVDQLVRDRGYTAANWKSPVFEGATHDETDWAARLDVPLQFLLAPETSPAP
jgi:pimeloyl-ACP methyl ester carboxylesterase